MANTETASDERDNEGGSLSEASSLSVGGQLTGTPDHVASAPPSGRGRRRPIDRLLFWRSPQGQPSWARPGLLGITAVAALLYTWNITDNGLAIYYSTAVRSMSQSWHAFFYGAMDPTSTITLDKLAGAFVPQALAVRVFGYHGWVLALPEVLAGIVSVLVMYRIGRRWQGPAAGLLAAGLFTTTPVIASVFGHTMEDGLLTLCLVLAADAFQHALVHARLRSLVWCGVWIGIGFQMKMLQAWTVVPAMGLTYLLAAPVVLRRRITHLAVAGAAMLAVSVSWLVLYAVTPAGDRPFVDGTTNNNAFTMAFGYDGISHFHLHLSGVAPSPFLAAVGAAPGSGDPDLHQVARALGGPGGAQPWTKLVEAGYGSQVGWLYPLAVLGLVIGLLRSRGAPRTDPGRGGFLFWGLWLATFAAVFSVILTPHTAYLASLAPPIAALSAAGIVLAWRAYREGGPLWWMLPLMIAAQAAWTGWLGSRYAGFLPWLTWAAVVVAVVAAVGLAAARRLRAVREPWTLAAAVAGVTAMIAVPCGWSASVLDPKYGGTEFDATAGPVPRMIDVSRLGVVDGHAGPFTNVGTVAQLPAPHRQIVAYLMAHREGARYLAATDGWVAGGPFIAATGGPFLPMGGFSGAIPAPRLPQVQRLVATGQLRFFLFSPFSPPKVDPVGSAVRPDGPTAITRWVRSTCTDITSRVISGALAGPQATMGLSLVECPRR